MQELLDPRGDLTCGICGQLHPRSGFYGYGEDEDGRGRLICIRCLCEMVAKAPASAWHPLESDAVEHKPPEPEQPYPHGTGANYE